MLLHLLIFLFTLTVGIFIPSASAAQATQRPNIILIYADDLGMGVLGCYGQKIIKTPNIDRLAKQGMRFDRVYSSQYCCPARASLLMGVHDSHKNSYTETKGGLVIEMDKNQWSLKEFNQKASANIKIKPSAQEVFLPQLLKKAGYVTAQFGKLDWGFTTYHDELVRHGWDHYIGYYDHVRAHGFYPTYLWQDGEQLPLAGNTHINAGKTPENYSLGSTAKRRDRTGKATYAPDVFLEGMLRFMEKNKEKPFFIFSSTTLPHGPVDVPAKDLAYENNKDIIKAYKDSRGNNTECAEAAMEYASMVKKLDDQVGQIIKKLEELELDRKTLIIFTSDNGHEIYYRTDKNRGRSLGYHGGREDSSGFLLDVFMGNRGDIGPNGTMIDLAGLKWTNWEGGIRVPMIAYWPGTISPAQRTTHLTANYDHMATFAELAGVEIPKGKDSLSYKDALFGKTPKAAHDYVVIDQSIICADGWKLTRKGGWKLFNLRLDPGERNNLAEKDEERFQKLKKIHDKEIGSARRDKY